MLSSSFLGWTMWSLSARWLRLCSVRAASTLYKFGPVPLLLACRCLLLERRNKHFNKKIKRAYDKYTIEIRQNLERGTAL